MKRQIIALLTALILIQSQKVFALTADDVCGITSTEAPLIVVRQTQAEAINVCNNDYPSPEWTSWTGTNVFDSSQWIIQCEKHSGTYGNRTIFYANGTYNCYYPDPNDSDGDGVPDSEDECPNDPNKSEQGACGCGRPDIDSDGDGLLDCVEPGDRGVITRKATCDGVLVYMEVTYEDGTVKRLGSQSQYNLIQNGVSTCTNANILKNSVPTTTWAWDYDPNVMSSSQLQEEILASGLTESDGTYEAEKKTGTPTEGDSGTENNDSGNLKTIADNTKKITENQTVQANKTDVSNSHLSEIKDLLGNLVSKTNAGYEGPSALEIATENDQKASTRLAQLDQEAQSSKTSFSDFSIDSSTIDGKTSVLSGTDYTEPGALSSESWWTNFQSNNPLQTALSGTSLTTSNPTCSMSVDLGGHFGTITLSICNLANSLAGFRLIFLPVVTLSCLVMVMRG